MMRPLRIAREEEVTYVDANELLLQRGQHEWLAIMYYSDFMGDVIALLTPIISRSTL